jgi:type IV pilus assembly protein PilN
MRIAVNLASHPYVELRPVYSRLRTWIVILALVGGAMWYLYRNERMEAAASQARVTALDNQVRDLEHEQQNYQTLMQQPKDAAILRQSSFLNGLFQRKAFSWTATMTDLETVLPTGVQVMSIDPIVAPDGHVTIRLRVTGERSRALDLIRNLEKSRHFASPRLASETLATGQGGPQNVSTSDVNFDILADYRPLPLIASQQEPDSQDKSADEKKAQPAAKKPRAAMEGQSTP